MVAALRTDTTPRPLALLFEPDPPGEAERAQIGWRRVIRTVGAVDETVLERRHADDGQGAAIQHAIARYVIGGVRRSAIAARLGVSETQAQYYLRGCAWRPYAAPVLRALDRLGISRGRGERWRDGRRLGEVAAASALVMMMAADALAGAPMTVEQRDELAGDLRLLAAGLGAAGDEHGR